MVENISSPNLFSVIDALIYSGAKSAVKYVNEKLIMRVTWRYKPSKSYKRQEFVVTYGAPNYLEREFVKKCKKSGEPFPVNKIQFRYYPKKKAN